MDIFVHIPPAERPYSLMGRPAFEFFFPRRGFIFTIHGFPATKDKKLTHSLIARLSARPPPQEWTKQRLLGPARHTAGWLIHFLFL